MPYLRITGPVLDAERRVAVAARLTDAVVELFTPPRGPSADDIRSRTTVHFTAYGTDELFVGGRAAGGEDPDVTVELSDWLMSTRQQSRAAAALSPLVGDLYDAKRDAVNLRFHSSDRRPKLPIERISSIVVGATVYISSHRRPRKPVEQGHRLISERTEAYKDEVQT